MEDYKVVIAGSRTFEDYEKLKNVCDYMLSEKTKTHNIVIVSGCAKGADTLGEKYAAERGYEVLKFPADWNSYGKLAGFIRNTEMAKVGNACICFWNGKSKGTENMIDNATRLGLKVKVVYF